MHRVIHGVQPARISAPPLGIGQRNKLSAQTWANSPMTPLPYWRIHRGPSHKLGVSLSGITQKTHGSTLILTLSQPDRRNAMSIVDLIELRSVIMAAGETSGVRCIVVTGAGGHFSAGADIRELQDLTTPERARHHASIAQAACDSMEQCPVPIIAAIEGFCVGGGVEIAISCDLRMADPSARFGQVELGIGSIAAWGGIRRLPRLIGVPQAKRLVYTYEHINADEALRIGLIEKISPPGEVLNEALAWAERIGQAPKNAIAWSKRALDQSVDVPLYAGLQADREVFAALVGGEEFQSGVSDFLNKKSKIL